MNPPMPPEQAAKRAERLRTAWRYYSMVSEVATPANLVVFALALVVIVVGALGGWDRVKTVEAEIPAATVGKAVDATPFHISVHDAWVAESPPLSVFVPQGHRVIMVRGEIRNDSDKPVSSGGPLQWALMAKLDGCGLPLVDTPEGCQSHANYRVVDPHDASSLLFMGDVQPGVSQGFVMVFTQQLSRPVPKALELTFSAQTWRTSSLQDAEVWAEATPIGRLELPVRAWNPTAWSTR